MLNHLIMICKLGAMSTIYVHIATENVKFTFLVVDGFKV